MRKFISIVTPCYNEEGNIEELSTRIAQVMSSLPYHYAHIFIDNHSTDGTVEKIRKIAAQDARVKLIINTRNFGHVRSPYHGILESQGDGCILMASDLQDPPEMITEFIKKWEQGYKIILAIKPESKESSIMFFIRKFGYHVISSISEIKLVPNATGTGLFDRRVIDVLRKMEDPYPYFRGLLCEIGFPIATVPFLQPQRKKGITKNNFYTIYDLGMVGIINHSKVPLRLMTMGGFLIAIFSLLIGCGFFLAKLIFWNFFTLGMAPILIGMFFLAAIQMFFIGIIGEYVGMIYTRVRKMPLVVEAERVNFSHDLQKDPSNLEHVK